jgi:hypothetical protein
MVQGLPPGGLPITPAVHGVSCVSLLGQSPREQISLGPGRKTLSLEFGPISRVLGLSTSSWQKASLA